MFIAVVAVGKNNELGKDNKLPWHLPNDLKHFKEVTDGMALIMGRETFESLPGVLPGREHIVLTRNADYKVNHPNVKVVYDVDSLLKMLEPEKDYSVIGGRQIFNLLMPYTKRIYLTRIDLAFDADTYFDGPDPKEWFLTSEEEGTVDEKNPLPHKFQIFDRKKT